MRYPRTTERRDVLPECLFFCESWVIRRKSIIPADPTDVCLLQASWSRRLQRLVESVTSRRVGGRYGSRTRDFQILYLVLLPSELTVSDAVVSEPIHGTGSTELCRVVCTPLDERHQGTLLTKDAGGSRTHLRLLCRQPPDRPAPGHWGIYRKVFS